MVKGRISGLLLGTSLMVALQACAPVISEEWISRVDKSLIFKEVKQDPESYRGRFVLWAGVIISAKNFKEGTLIEILQTSMDRQYEPIHKDQSEGRFLALYEGYLDVAVYESGREVTVAGEIKGKRTLPLGEMEYPYPLIAVKEIYLWPKEEKQRYLYDPYYPYPWWWYHPYWGPWW